MIPKIEAAFLRAPTRSIATGVISALNRDIKSQLGTTIPGGIQTGVRVWRPRR